MQDLSFIYNIEIRDGMYQNLTLVRLEISEHCFVYRNMLVTCINFVLKILYKD